jgi:anti-sigma-K factor RskA
MNKDFDFDNAGKRMPYTTPDGFFDKLEEDIWIEVKNDCREKEADKPVVPAEKQAHRKPFKWRILMRSAVAVAASIALALIVNMHFSTTSHTTPSGVDQAFSQLSSDDQAYLLDIYQDDVFINE